MKIPLFDAHCDTIYKVYEDQVSLRKNTLHVDLERGLRYEPYAQVFAVFTRPWPTEIDVHNMDYSADWGSEVLVPMSQELLDVLLSEFTKNKDILSHCRSAEDAAQAARNKKIAAFIAVEGAELIGCDLSKLHWAYDMGVRLINLCWNYDNALCGAANGASKGGLTNLGKTYVEEMQRLGVAVDLSHASEKTFWDVTKIAKKPIIAGHSNAKAICDNARNLTDAQIREIVRLDGAIGLNLCPDFLSADGVATIEHIVRHIEHFLELGCEKTLCLGGDFDGIDSTPIGISGIESFEVIYEELLRRNYPTDLLNNIFYYNLLRVLEAAL